VTFMDSLKHWLGIGSHAKCQAQEKTACREERLGEADKRLHDQATRLHVLEWEAYGRRRHRSRPHLSESREEDH
jgi:hypothetical protein